MEEFVTTFARIDEFRKAEAALQGLALPYRAIGPEGYGSAVDVPALVVDDQTRRALYAAAGDAFVCAGWIGYHATRLAAPGTAKDAFSEDIFGKAHVMVLQPCAAAPEKIRFTAHLSGDLSQAFPYMNAVMPNAYYNVNGPTFTFMDGYRMITAYPMRVAAAKADDVVDAWRVLAMIRTKANECWAARANIAPSCELRHKPPALEIYYRLPRTNCGKCGEKACMAFALRLWNGQTAPSKCTPIFEGTHGHLRDPLLEICAGLGVQKG